MLQQTYVCYVVNCAQVDADALVSLKVSFILQLEDKMLSDRFTITMLLFTEHSFRTADSSIRNPGRPSRRDLRTDERTDLQTHEMDTVAGPKYATPQTGNTVTSRHQLRCTRAHCVGSHSQQKKQTEILVMQLAEAVSRLFLFFSFRPIFSHSLRALSEAGHTNHRRRPRHR